MPENDPLRVAVVGADGDRRAAVLDQLAGLPAIEVVAWAERTALLALLGTRADVCLALDDGSPDDGDAAARLRDRGCTVVVVPAGGDAATFLAATGADDRVRPPALPRPQLSPRQRTVLRAYAESNELLPTVARRLGLEPETVKTHLRRVRAKYDEVGRPAPTRRDLYVRAVEDGLLPPPTGPLPRW